MHSFLAIHALALLTRVISKTVKRKRIFFLFIYFNLFKWAFIISKKLYYQHVCSQSLELIRLTSGYIISFYVLNYWVLIKLGSTLYFFFLQPMLICDAAQGAEEPEEAGSVLARSSLASLPYEPWQIALFHQWTRAALKVPWSSPSVCPGNNPLVTGALLKGHYWMNSETRFAVNGQFGYTAMRLELLGVMYRLSTCQLYKGGSRLCKCVCK